ncbi:galectin-8 isoform X1 [Protopterus annectens]|uniref:galectin-8 isoform X1 n=1 Tax=Protopterus annectens TaxID=7888 RepID=UPI001CFBB2ED|nr:galectin-8 isoform X1 [Protopterus annectens]
MSLDNPCQMVSNPTIPYIGTIIGGLHHGDMVVIHGCVPSDADRFQIDFQCGNSIEPRADVAFHFNPRFKWSPYIVCNTLQNSTWGREEFNYIFPFEKGQRFEIFFMVSNDKFKVAVNGKHILQYGHRIALNRIDILGIYGKVQIETVGFFSSSFLGNPSLLLPLSQKMDEKNSLGNPSLLSPLSQKMDEKNSLSLERYKLLLPYSGVIDGGLKPGYTIAVKGEIDNKNPDFFVINLSSKESGDIALHLNPRMKPKTFVRNSFLYNCWGEEEKNLSYFPFKPGMYFEIIILCETHQYKVAVNGEHTLEYKHRFKDLNKINQLEINGAVRLLGVSSW